MKQIFTSESVNIGHPDKTCDFIADAFLDEALSQDALSQMAVECSIKNDKLFIYGEATTNAKIEYEDIAKSILKDIGYTNDWEIIKEISGQSQDIAQAVLKKKLCANDQGMMFGYATNETKQFMPLPILIAHKLMENYEKFRKSNNNYFADAKCQVSVEYEGRVPKEITTIIISVSHSESISQNDIKQQIERLVKTEIENLLHGEHKICENVESKNMQILVNPSGRFTIWGSFGDSGCTGRKIVVDSYGGKARVGGGCFSSKNATKVDRSGAYYARYVAKNIVAHGFADECEIEVSYAIGLSQPISIYVDCKGTNKISQERIEKIIHDNFNFERDNISEELELVKPIYKKTACYGHFGRDEFPWEKIKTLKL